MSSEKGVAGGKAIFHRSNAMVPSLKQIEMKVHINKKLCIGCEVCINHCPDVFMIWGMHMKADFEVPHPERYRSAVAEAATLCPKRAISYEA